MTLKVDISAFKLLVDNIVLGVSPQRSLIMHKSTENGPFCWFIRLSLVLWSVNIYRAWIH